MAINTSTFSGRLTRDSELRVTKSGSKILSFSVAVEEYRKDAENYVNYFDCVMFGSRAEKLEPHLKKGRKVSVSATAHQQRWETEDGQKRSKVEFWINDLEFMDAGEKKDESPEVYDEDVPF